jgi:hypothetical protein
MSNGTSSEDKCDVELDALCDALQRVLPPPELQARLLSVLQLVDEAFERAGVTYWLTGGTLLGAVRHGGFIPHDDDVDIEIMESDLERAVEALGAVGRSFRGLGEWLDSGVAVGRFFVWSGTDSAHTNSIDVFLREAALNELREFPSYSEIFPLQRVPFHNLSLPVPQAPDFFFERCYSPLWLEEAVVWGHTSCGRTCFRAPLDRYNQAVLRLGYNAPMACPTAAESLSIFALDCHGELRDHLWANLGWASPCPLEWSSGDVDPEALSMLDLETRQWDVVADALPELHAGGLDNLRSCSGAFVSIDTQGPRIRAVGSADELECLEKAVLQILSKFTSAPLDQQHSPNRVPISAC